MKLVLIIGDSSVGKMTVGQEITKITNLKLFHNHMMIEPVLEIFGSFNTEAIKKLRDVIFDEFVKTDNYGLIFTFMWAFDHEADTAYVNSIINRFTNVGGEIYCVELVTNLETRLERNVTENRLKNKASKRDVDTSTKRLLSDGEKYRLVSYENELPFENYLKIDNTYLEATEVAKLIKDKFNFK